MSYLDRQLTCPSNLKFTVDNLSDELEMQEVLSIIEKTDCDLMVAKVAAMLTTRYDWEFDRLNEDRCIVLIHPDHSHQIVMQAKKVMTYVV